ncbi:RNA 3'-terminal phosphate cyclase [Candidatus Woesearchaeota archaeon]|nr:RNA 3'-terminal phosphate cyclase [Candidatus Woesearchaeota archaeon]
MLKIDGNYLEGGGQIVRTALAISTLTGIPFEVDNIRKGRCKPGLKQQHLTCITSLQKLCNAKVEGDELGSSYLKYEPGTIKPKTLSIDIGTAGSITLLLQSLLFPCIFAGKKIRLKIKGGTDVTWSMPFDYLQHILIPHLQKYCESINVKLLRRGYYPKGGGSVEIEIKPKFSIYNYNNYAEFIEDVSKKVKPITLTQQGHLIQVKGISHAAKQLQESQVAERQAKSAKQALSKLNVPVSIRREYQDTLSPGSGITLWAIFSLDKSEIDFNNPIRIGSDSLGERGKRSEIIGREAAERLLNEINYKAPVDEYLADNLIPFLIFGGKFKAAKISNHALTNIYTVENFFGRMFDVDNKQRIISRISLNSH